MTRLSTSTAIYLATATFLGAVALPASLDFAATTNGSGAQMAQAGASATAPSAHRSASHAKSASLQKGQQPVDRVEARIKEMHAQLKITPDQEDKWNAYTQVMRDNAQSMQSLIEQRTQNQRTMSAMDDLNSYEQITEANADGVKKLVPAFQALYDSMSPEQKKNADLVFSRYSQRLAAKNGMSASADTRHTAQKSKTQVQ